MNNSLKSHPLVSILVALVHLHLEKSLTGYWQVLVEGTQRV